MKIGDKFLVKEGPFSLWFDCEKVHIILLSETCYDCSICKSSNPIAIVSYDHYRVPLCQVILLGEENESRS